MRTIVTGGVPERTCVIQADDREKCRLFLDVSIVDIFLLLVLSHQMPIFVDFHCAKQYFSFIRKRREQLRGRRIDTAWKCKSNKFRCWRRKRTTTLTLLFVCFFFFLLRLSVHSKTYYREQWTVLSFTVRLLFLLLFYFFRRFLYAEDRWNQSMPMCSLSSSSRSLRLKWKKERNEECRQSKLSASSSTRPCWNVLQIIMAMKTPRRTLIHCFLRNEWRCPTIRLVMIHRNMPTRCSIETKHDS